MERKSIFQFINEYGLGLPQLAQMTGIELEKLAEIQLLTPAPEEYAQIIIDEYDLPANYFSGEELISEEPAQKLIFRTSNFIGLSIGWNLVVGLISLAVVFLISAVVFTVNLATSNSVSGVFDKLIEYLTYLYIPIGILLLMVIFVFACKWLANHLEKIYRFSPDKRKYMFAYYIIPNGMLGFASAFASLIFPKGSTDSLLTEFLNTFQNFIFVTVLPIMFLAVMMKLVANYTEKDKKTLKIFCCIFLISKIIEFVLEVISNAQNGTDVIFICKKAGALLLSIVFAVGFIRLEDKKEIGKLEQKLIYYVLPVILMLFPSAINTSNLLS